MDSQIIKNSLNQVGFLSRIILQFYARNRSTFVNVIKVAAISWSATVVVNVRQKFCLLKSHYMTEKTVIHALFREYIKLISVPCEIFQDPSLLNLSSYLALFTICQWVLCKYYHSLLYHLLLAPLTLYHFNF